ncbi:McrC family protein [Candidatus Uabimicrobium sp. HlEnr_7]|uniref:McrC family protein n=1 Tax=Candidatus Uabimicrobium helgolandensis TaxID=3095367 RepID=UPI0035583C39
MSKYKPLVLTEYQKADIGESWNPEKTIIPNELVSKLEILQRQTKRKIFNISRNSIQACNFVGTLAVENYSIDILPKIDKDNNSTRANLIHMLQIAKEVPYLEAGQAFLDENYTTTILDHYMYQYVIKLAFEWRRGRICDYKKVSQNRHALRGKLELTAHLRKNAINKHHFFTTTDVFQEDVKLAQILKAALKICLVESSWHNCRKKAQELWQEFEHISDVVISEYHFKNLKINRLLHRFSPIIELATMILHGKSPNLYGRAKTYSLLFDMNVVFERYIANLLRKECDNEFIVDTQNTDKHLLTKNNKSEFSLRPDIVIYNNEEIRCIIDTKWKHLNLNKRNYGISQSDMYQMYAYGKIHNCRKVILLYPKVDNSASIVAKYNDDKNLCIYVCTVDTRWGKQNVCKYIKQLF